MNKDEIRSKIIIYSEISLSLSLKNSIEKYRDKIQIRLSFFSVLKYDTVVPRMLARF